MFEGMPVRGTLHSHNMLLSSQQLPAYNAALAVTKLWPKQHVQQFES